jgi:hypothetical protein
MKNRPAHNNRMVFATHIGNVTMLFRWDAILKTFHIHSSPAINKGVVMDEHEIQRMREASAAADKYFHDTYWKPVDDAHYREYQRRAGERKSR